MNIYIYIAIIAFTYFALKYFLSKKPMDTEGTKLLCPKCDNLIAEVTFPSGSVYLLRAVKDQWMSRYYSRIKLLDEHFFVCPECSETTHVTKKQIMDGK